MAAAPTEEARARREPRVMLAVRLAQGGIDALDRVAQETGQTRSQAIRAALYEYVARHDKAKVRR